MAKFFEVRPTIMYNGVQCKNITQRTTLTQEVQRAYTAFYDYYIQDGERPDVVAYKAYGDQYYDWLVYYSNGVVDPYHGWFLSDVDFAKYIANKYGSVAEADERIAYYRVSHTDQKLTAEEYNSLLPRRKKYWRPVIDDVNAKPLYYERMATEHKVNTNQLVQLTAALNETRMAKLSVGEHVTQVVNGVLVASGDVVRVTETTADIANIDGSFVVGVVTGMSTDTVVNVGGVSNVGVSIHPDELIYWEPVTYFMHEQEINESRRVISMLVPAVATQAVRAHEEKVNERV